MQKPSIGRCVHYYPRAGEMPVGTEGVCAATIVRVHGDTCLNLIVFDANGSPHAKTSVAQRQCGPSDGGVWDWPAYVPPTSPVAEAARQGFYGK